MQDQICHEFQGNMDPKLELQTSSYLLERARKIFFSKRLLASLPPHTQRHGVNNMEGNQLLIQQIFNPFIVFKDTLEKNQYI